MLAIHKFGPYQPGDEFVIECRKIVHFGPQGNGELFVWAEVVKEGLVNNKPMALKIIGTGHLYEPVYEHFATTVTKGGFVWHLMQPIDFWKSFSGF